jgi:hypothetical protein
MSCNGDRRREVSSTSLKTDKTRISRSGRERSHYVIPTTGDDRIRRNRDTKANVTNRPTIDREVVSRYDLLLDSTPVSNRVGDVDGSLQ